MMTWKVWPVIFVGYSIIAAIIYAPSINGPWQYDDYAQILDQKVLTSRDLGKLLPSLFRFTAWPDGWTGTRDFVRATFWLNWTWWELEPLGYRIVNLGIHVVNAMLVTVLVAELLGGPRAKGQGPREEKKQGLSFSLQPSSFVLAGLAGLLFLIHPLQSQAVAYVAQRFTSVATMGYLATVVAWLLALRASQGTRDKGQGTREETEKLHRIPLAFSSSSPSLFRVEDLQPLALFWYVLALLSALVAYNSKEITITLPGVLLLILIMVSKSSTGNTSSSSSTGSIGRDKLRALPVLRALLVLPFFLLALKIPLQVISASTTNLTADPEKIPGIIIASVSVEQKNPPPSRLEYFLTEQNVMRTYLRLLVLPIRQTLDYDYPITKEWDVGTAASGFLHLVLIGMGGWLLFKREGKLETRDRDRDRDREKNNNSFSNLKSQIPNPPLRLVGLGILWFYVTVGIESTFIAIPDVIYEHRVYLPFVGFVMVFAGGISYLIHKNSYLKFGRRPSFTSLYILLTAYFLLLAAATFRRSVVWGNEVRLWKDVYEKAAEKPRAVKNYGVVLAASGKYDEGIKHLLRAVELDPDNADYWSNLGTAYLRSQRFDEASGRFKRAYELGIEEAERMNMPPAKETAQYMSDYGVTLVQLKRGDDAKPAFERALELNPELYAARLGLGAAKNLLGDLDGAAEDFRRLTQEHPDQPDAFGNLATILTKQGKLQDALSVLLKLKKLHPSYEGIDGRIATVNRLLLQGSGE